ncbi:MAG: hypothetical protein WC374_09340 [Phycisphaerae bacterium]|jgi:hypothetical protein
MENEEREQREEQESSFQFQLNREQEKLERTEPAAEKHKEALPARPVYILPPKNYKLWNVLIFADVILLAAYIYILIIIDIIRQVSAGAFSFVSSRTFAYYCVLAITIGLGIVVLLCKKTRSARTRHQRDNELRQDESIKVWLTGFDWGWPILFLPTVALLVIAGFVTMPLHLIGADSPNVATLEHIIGAVVIIFGSLNAAVVIFKLRPVTLGLILGGIVIGLLLLLLHGPGTLAGFFKSFRYMGVTTEPLGYILIAYIWSIFLRIIWVRSLFYYWVFVPNRLEMQHGLSESNDSVDREDLRLAIDTDDVILRWWNVGIITFYFPRLDRLPITNVVFGIRKKAQFANRIASIKTVQD